MKNYQQSYFSTAVVFFTLLGFAFLNSQCTSAKLDSAAAMKAASEQKALEKIAEEILGSTSFATKPNSTGDYIIVSRNRKDIKELFATVDFFIFKKATEEVIFQDSLFAGSASWVSYNKILAVARNLKDDDGNKIPNVSYYYNVSSREKRMID